MKAKYLLVSSLLLLPGAYASGNLQPASVFTDNMVLQRECPVPVWGTAAPGEAVTVEFADQKKTATADGDGRWRVALDPLAASKEPRGMTLRGAGTTAIVLTNVVVGEVWLCSGQSNMEWTMAKSADFEKERADADQPLIRHFKVPRRDRPFPEEKVGAQWVVCTPETVGEFTAAGYFFAREIERELGVPVGLLNASYGGTRIEPWATPDSLMAAASLPELAARVRKASPSSEEGKANYAAYLRTLEEWLPRAIEAVEKGKVFPPPPDEPWITGNEQQPTRLCNGMVAPLVPFAIRGVLWYQGEGNAGDASNYAEKTKALVGGWRRLWSDPQMPFYYVQLAGFQTSDPAKPAMGDGWARLREEQLKALAIPDSGMAVAIDIGEAADIHPKNKQDVGRRLARWALAETYGKGGTPTGPIYRSHRAGEGKIVVEFEHADSGLFLGTKDGQNDPRPAVDGKLPWIAIAGADGKFQWADVVIDGPRLVVWNKGVPDPVAVRYAFTQNPEGAKLYNKEGLPASPFRTDNWTSPEAVKR
jgi:sialate O-acetylesterase